jgi:cytochrome P450
LQLLIASDLLGIPEPDRAEVSRYAMDLGRAIILVPFVTPERGNGDAEAGWLRRYVAALLPGRRRAGGDDVISAMLRAEHDGQRLTDDEVIDNAVFLLFAGFETSIHLIAGACAALLAFPDQLARLRADRSLIPTAVEEILRYDAPLQWVSRMPSEPVEVDGRVLKPGRVALLMLGSANHDGRQFTEPARLDVGRQPNPHLSFGGGPHHCLGVLLARAQGAIVLGTLLDRCAVIEPAGAPVRRLHPNIRGYASVPMMVSGA